MNRKKKKKIVEKLYRIQRGNCMICGDKMWFPVFQNRMTKDELEKFLGAKPSKFNHVSLEHVKPTSLGGSEHIINLVLTHASCNSRRGSKCSIFHTKTLQKFDAKKQLHIRRNF